MPRRARGCCARCTEKLWRTRTRSRGEAMLEPAKRRVRRAGRAGVNRRNGAGEIHGPRGEGARVSRTCRRIPVYLVTRRRRSHDGTGRASRSRSARRARGALRALDDPGPTGPRKRRSSTTGRRALGARPLVCETPDQAAQSRRGNTRLRAATIVSLHPRTGSTSRFDHRTGGADGTASASGSTIGKIRGRSWRRSG